MKKCKPRGNPTAPIWIITEEPYKSDEDKGTLYSGPMGYMFDRCLRDCGFDLTQCFITSLSDEAGKQLDYQDQFKIFMAALDFFKPPFIVPVGKLITALFCPETKVKKGKNVNRPEASLEKYAGSILSSPYVSHDHMVIPILTPDALAANFQYKTIYIQMDLGRIWTEFSWFRDNNKKLQPLTRRSITIQPEYRDLIDVLKGYESAKYLGDDIETIRPSRGSEYYGKHPGYLYTIALAPSPYEAVAFALWDYKEIEIVGIFRQLQRLFWTSTHIGQNYFTFDSHFYEAYGLSIDFKKVQDTMLRHQILWPELPHKLQFLTKQYTRQPYYKDEGKAWSPKYKKALLHYNALDALVTHEVFLEQETEFNDRPYLR